MTEKTDSLGQYFAHERGFYMSIYAFTLAGGNFLAPVICGFIAEYQGWRWVFYWPSIFLAVLLVFLFFALEETNYERQGVDIAVDTEKATMNPEATNENTPPSPSGKTYFQKLALFSTQRGTNSILRRIWQTGYFLTWPVIFYTGWVPPPVFHSFFHSSSLAINSTNEVVVHSRGAYQFKIWKF